MNSSRGEIYRVEEEIAAIGLSMCRLLPPGISESMTAHLRELFEANEYGEAMVALKWLEEKDGVDPGADVRAMMDRIRSLMDRLKLLCDGAAEK